MLRQIQTLTVRQPVFMSYQTVEKKRKSKLNSFLVVEPKGSKLLIPKLTIEHDPKPVLSTSHPLLTYFLRTIFTLSFRLSLIHGYFPQDFLIKILYTFLVACILVMCPGTVNLFYKSMDRVNTLKLGCEDIHIL
jgi:hypothetical protein